MTTRMTGDYCFIIYDVMRQFEINVLEGVYVDTFVSSIDNQLEV